MRITIIGGHGKVALLAEPLLVGAGNSVRAFIRAAGQAGEVAATGAEPVVADVEGLGTGELAGLFEGQDAIVWSAGAGGGSPERTLAVDRDAAIRAVDAAGQAGVRRFVMVSYLGAGRNHGVPEDDGFHSYAEAKAAADAHLRASGLDWTILGPGALTTEDGTGRIVTVEHLPGGGTPPQLAGGRSGTSATVPRADVAGVIAAALADDTTVGRTIDFVGGGERGGTPTAEAIRG